MSKFFSQDFSKQRDELLDVSAMATWLADEDNLDSRSFRMLLTKAWNAIVDAPWSVKEVSSGTTEREIHNIGVKTLEDAESSTSPDIQAINSIDISDTYNSGHDNEYTYDEDQEW